MNKNQIEYLVRQRDFSLTDGEVYSITEMLIEDINNENYDFSNYKKEIFTKQKKKRAVYSYPKLSCEDILCQYLKKQLDSVFHIKYASRSRVINILFNILPVVRDMNDFVIIRADFKSFFDSVLTEHVFDKYIKESMLRRQDKELLEEYVSNFKYSFAGLCLSNGMTEIVCRDFDARIRAKLTKYGLFFYERYVDDILLITNKYISKIVFLKIMEETIKEVFGKSPVKINSSPEKFSYICKRDMIVNTPYEFNFLGYQFALTESPVAKNGKTVNVINFKYGIAEKKRLKYKNIIEKAFIQYTKDGNIELLRQRIKIYSARVVIARTIGSSSYDWLTKGVVANYNELQHHMNSLIPSTQQFMKCLYFDLLTLHSCSVPYFMKQSISQESIYNIYSNMKRNRTILFQESIGVSEGTILKWIYKIDSSYVSAGKDYYRIVGDYLELIKVE